MISFEGTKIEPPIPYFQAKIKALELDVRSFKEPLKRSVKEVMSPSLRRNFDQGGRPVKWANLKSGGPSYLTKSGLLRRVAGQQNLWRITRDKAEIQGMPRAEYGEYHQSGTGKMPQRRWALIQSEDEDRIMEVFEEWLEERIRRNWG